MKNLMSLLLVTSFIIAGLTTTMCEKDEENSEHFKLLTAHTWNFDTIVTICKDPEIIMFVGWLAESFQGGTVTYGSDGSFALSDVDGDAIESGKWKFSNNETEIITFDEDDPTDILGHVRIDVLTETVLEATDIIDIPVSDTCYVTIKWMK
ncbi:hypothetical protein ACFLTA_09550 [Bacteroidota bacterium]